MQLKIYDEGQCHIIESDSFESAISEHEEHHREYYSDTETFFDSFVYEDPDSGDHLTHSFSLHPIVDECDHVWISNDDTRGHGGGVTCSSTCYKCGRTEHYNSFANSPLDGTQGHETYSYSTDESDIIYGVDLLFDNGGGVTLQSADYCHFFVSAEHAIPCIVDSLYNPTSSFDNNEPVNFVRPCDYSKYESVMESIDLGSFDFADIEEHYGACHKEVMLEVFKIIDHNMVHGINPQLV